MMAQMGALGYASFGSEGADRPRVNIVPFSVRCGDSERTSSAARALDGAYPPA